MFRLDIRRSMALSTTMGTILEFTPYFFNVLDLTIKLFSARMGQQKLMLTTEEAFQVMALPYKITHMVSLTVCKK